MMFFDSSTMHFKVSILLLFICYLLVGCSYVPSELKIAEQIVETYPDSALHILQHLKPEKYKNPADHALYGLLLFHALERADKKIQPVSLIDSSINYFQSKKDDLHLAGCYFFKGHMFKHAQRYEDASVLYLKAIDCLQNSNQKDLILFGKIYTDIGYIYSIQNNYSEAKKKYQTSFDFFKQAGDVIDTRFVLIDIGRVYSYEKDHTKALRYYRKAISKIKNSYLFGLAYQEIGINYYSLQQFDSAQYYLRKSLLFPYTSTSYSIRNCILADLLFDKDQFDSSYVYASKALKYPTSIYLQRNCYRILTNIEYTRKNIKQMGVYMSHYQDYSDSVRVMESQTKMTVLENLHNKTQEAKGTRMSMILIVSCLLVILLLCIYFSYFLYMRNKLKNVQLDNYKKQLQSKQEFVNHRLTKKIEETRALQTEKRKNGSVEDRINLDKELYNNALYINNKDDFNRLMNQAFNNIVINLSLEYPSINQKEITWCCLHLLDIPHADRMLLLEASSDSLYKLKQRLAHKLNLNTTKELDSFLVDLISLKD